MNDYHRHVFLNGFLRSGTTLLEKLLHNHPDICIGAQPFPYLYYHVKEQFFHARGIEQRRYPLGTLFLEDDYSQDEFHTFLKNYNVSVDEVANVLLQMEGYSGQLTQDLISSPGEITSGSFFEIYKCLTARVAALVKKNSVGFHGAKEVFCEEFIPYFLDNGVKVINIIREPRDMLASVNFGKGGEYTGNLPTLYLLLKWRKSVAFSLRFEDHPGFTSVFYEDLVKNTWEVLDRLTAFLDLEPMSRQTFSEGIRDQYGELWQGNSSFNSYQFVSDQSIGKYKKVLSEDIIRFLENICYPEMKALHYDRQFCKDGPQEEIVLSFRDPMCPVNSEEMKKIGLNSSCLDNEIKRYNLLLTQVDDHEATRWFIFPEVYRLLKQVIL